MHLVRNANPLNVASCSSEQKRILYEISNTAFSSQRNDPISFYNLIKPSIGENTRYLSFWLFLYCCLIKLLTNFLFSLCTLTGGASLADLETLSQEGVSMDVETFRSLNLRVITVRMLLKELITECLGHVVFLFVLLQIYHNWGNLNMKEFASICSIISDIFTRIQGEFTWSQILSWHVYLGL